MFYLVGGARYFSRQTMLKIGLIIVLASILAPQAPESGGDAQRLAQALGFQCQTQYGVCPIPPAPVGATCFCGSVAGQVIP